MKQPSSRVLPTFVLAAFFLPLFAQTPKPASAPPTANNNGSDEPCGNPYYSWPVECPTCEDDNSSLLTFDIGSFCDISPMNAYTGSAQRSITDLSISGSVGNMPLEFKRYSSTRLSGRNLSHSSFGIESSWSHNFEWVMRDNGGTVTQPIIKLTYPDGREVQFRRPDATATVWNPTGKRIADRLIVNGDNLTLRTGDLKQFLFKRRIHSINGGVFYRIESFKDAESNTYTVSYDDNDDTLIRQVTDPANHWIKFHYNDLAVRSNASTVIGETLLPAGSTGVWKELAVTPGTAFRFLALHQGNTWRQKMPLRVAELEFYNQNNVKISGTAFGSWPWATSSEPFKATDGNINTQYQYAYEKVGYVGIDLGAGNASQVSRIRFRLAGTLNTDASVTFLGMNNEPTPNYVISHVEGSDGRQIGYDYSVYTEPSGIFQWAQLTAANYSDLTASAYTYKWQHRHVMPVLETADDPRDTNPVKKVRYSYDLNTVVGFVVDQYDDSSGQLLGSIRWDGAHIPKIVYPNGKIHRFEHTDGLLTRAINSYGATTDYTFDANGFVLTENDPNGRTTTYTRGGYGRVLSIKKPGGSLTTLTRDSVGYITARNENGKITTYTLDPTTKRRTRTDHPDGTYETWTYNTFGQKLSHRLRNATTESWAYNANGLLTGYTDPAGLLTTYTYNALKRLASSTRHLSTAPTDIHTTSYEYDDRGALTKITHPDGTFVQHIFDDYGHRLATLDERGAFTQWTYDSLGRKLTEKDPNGNITNFDYTNALGGGCGCNTGARPVLTTAPDGTQTLNQYDKEWRLTATIYAFGTPQATTTSYSYDLAGQRISSTDHLNSITTYAYDSDGRLASTIQASGTSLAVTTAHTYSIDGNLLSTTQAAGTTSAVTTQKTYDAMDRVLSTTVAFGTPLAATSSVSYNNLGQMISSTDPLGRITQYTYDAAGRNRDTIHPFGITTRTSYDAASRVTSTSLITANSTLSTSSATYDSRDRTITATDSDGITTQYWYDNGGLVTAISRTGVNTTFGYDANGNRLTTTAAPGTPQARVAAITYDSRNRPITQRDQIPLTATTFTTLSTTTTAYDRLSRPTSVTDGLGRVTNFTYTRDTTLKTETTVSTNPAGQATTTITNARGETQSTKNANNETTTYQYDPLGRLTSYIDPKGHTYSFLYDLLGRRTRRTEPDNTYQAYDYDRVGNMIQHRKADTSIATITYNNRNQPDLKVWNGNSEFTDWSYDAQGRLTSISNQNAITAYTYHGTSQRVATEATTLGSETRTITRTFDANIRLQSVTTTAVPHSLNYTYQPTTGKLHTINNDGPPPLATYGNQPSLTTTLALENGLTTTIQRDAAYQITSHSTAAGAAVKSSVAHGYDNAGRRKYAKYEDTQGQAYAYDNAGQVKNVLVNTTNPATANPASSPSHIYNYDANGNRNSALAFGSTTSYSANSVNAYTNISGGGILPPSQNPTYDANGNMLTGPVGTTPATLGYDKENRLRTLAQNNTTVGYTYDALGRLIETVSTAATDNRERYTWSGWTLLSREIFTGTSPTSTFRYTWGLDLSGTMEGAGGVGGLLAIERNVTGNNTWDTRFPHYDANGNIIALTDSSGTLSARYRYDAFGNTLEATDVDNTGWATQNIHRFSTKPTFGNTTLLYYGYRWYDPLTGRWPSRDPIEERGGVNLYEFVGNDGVNKLDVMGLKKCVFKNYRDVSLIDRQNKSYIQIAYVNSYLSSAVYIQSTAPLEEQLIGSSVTSITFTVYARAESNLGVFISDRLHGEASGYVKISCGCNKKTNECEAADMSVVNSGTPNSARARTHVEVSSSSNGAKASVHLRGLATSSNIAGSLTFGGITLPGDTIDALKEFRQSYTCEEE